MTGIEKKRNFIINTVYTVILLALFYLFFKYAFGTLFPFLVAIAAAMILQKPVNFISKKTPIKRGLASVFCVLLGFFTLIAILVLIGVWAGIELKGFIDYIIIQLEDIPAFVDKIEHYLANGLSFLPLLKSADTSGIVPSMVNSDKVFSFCSKGKAFANTPSYFTHLAISST